MQILRFFHPSLHIHFIFCEFFVTIATLLWRQEKKLLLCRTVFFLKCIFLHTSFKTRIAVVGHIAVLVLLQGCQLWTTIYQTSQAKDAKIKGFFSLLVWCKVANCKNEFLNSCTLKKTQPSMPETCGGVGYRIRQCQLATLFLSLLSSLSSLSSLSPLSLSLSPSRGDDNQPNLIFILPPPSPRLPVCEFSSKLLPVFLPSAFEGNENRQIYMVVWKALFSISNILPDSLDNSYFSLKMLSRGVFNEDFAT